MWEISLLYILTLRLSLVLLLIIWVTSNSLAGQVKSTQIVCNGSVEAYVLDTRPEFSDGNGSTTKQVFFSARIIEKRVIADEKVVPEAFPGGLKIGAVNLDSPDLGLGNLDNCTITASSVNCVQTTRSNRGETFVGYGSQGSERKIQLPEIKTPLSDNPVLKAIESKTEASIKIDRQTGILDTYHERKIRLSERVDDTVPFSARISHTGRFQCELASGKPKF